MVISLPDKAILAIIVGALAMMLRSLGSLERSRICSGFVHCVKVRGGLPLATRSAGSYCAKPSKSHIRGANSLKLRVVARSIPDQQ